MNVFELVAKIKIDTDEYLDDLNNASKATKSVGEKLGKGLDKAGKLAEKAFGIATAATVAFGTKAVSVGAEFDKSMSQVAATMGLSMDEMQDSVGSVDLAWGKFSGNLRDYAQEMGEHTAFSAKESADALNYMALAGYDVQQSMEMLPNVLNLAAAGGFDLARASDMVTDTQTAFGISTERTTQMVDEMAKAASTGNTSVEQLGDAFLVVGGLAKELNGGMVTLANGTQKPVDGVQELEIALTAMANAGVKGSEAGTHMRNMLLKLSSPTKEGVATLEELGVTVFDTSGQMRSLSDIFGDLSVAFEDLTQEEKIQAISDLFNTRDMASAEALLGAVGQDWDKIGESILNAQGSAQKMADTQLDNLSGDITLFKSALEGAYIAVSDTLAPALRDLVQMATDGLGKLTEYVKTHGDEIREKVKSIVDWVIKNLPKIIEMAKTAAKVLAGLWVADKIVKFVNGIKSAISIFKDLKLIVKGIVPAFKTLFTFLSANPAVLIIGGIIALIAAIKLLWDNCEEFRNFIKGVWEGIKIVVGAVVDAIVDFFKTAWETIKAVWGKVCEFFQTIWEGIKAVFSVVVSVLGGFFKTAWETIKAVWNTVVSFFEGIWKGIKAVFSVVAEVLKGFFETAWKAIKTVWDVVVGFFQGIWDGIKAIFSVVADVLGGAFSVAWDIIKGVWDTVAGFFQGVWDAITGIFSSVGDFFDGAFGGAVDLIEGAFSGIADFFSGIWEAIKGVFSGVAGWFADTFGAAASAVKSAFQDVADTVDATAAGISIVAGAPINRRGGGMPSNIPRHADGGVFYRPTLGIFGEAGAEAVVPLDQNKRWIHAVAQDFAAQMSGMGYASGAGGDIIIPVYIGQNRIDEIIVKSQQVRNYRRG